LSIDAPIRRGPPNAGDAESDERGGDDARVNIRPPAHALAPLSFSTLLMRARFVQWPLLLLCIACCHGQERASRRAFGFRSPTTGDTLVEGRTYTIRWTTAPTTRINLGVVMGGHDMGHLLMNAPTGVDSVVWTVPIGFVTGFGPLSSNQVRLRLENADSIEQWAQTGPFVITGARR
jgi:hypothetical protein